MRRVLHWIEQILNIMIALCIAGMTILIFTNVILRYIFHSGITWAEEMSRFMFIWMVFLGSILVLKEGTHIGVDMLVRRVPENLRKLLLFIGNLIILAIAFIVLKGSWDMTMDSLNSKAPATGISLAFMYVVGVIMSVGMILIGGVNLFKIFKGEGLAKED